MLKRLLGIIALAVFGALLPACASVDSSRPSLADNATPARPFQPSQGMGDTLGSSLRAPASNADLLGLVSHDRILPAFASIPAPASVITKND